MTSNPSGLYERSYSARELNNLDGLKVLSLGGVSYGILGDYGWPETLDLSKRTGEQVSEPLEVKPLDTVSPVLSAKRTENRYSVSARMFLPRASVSMESTLCADYDLMLDGPLDRIVSFRGLFRQFIPCGSGDQLSPEVLRLQPGQVLSALTYAIRYLRRSATSYERL